MRLAPPVPGRARRGAAIVELAILVPLLVFLFVIGTDFARSFYYSLTVANGARNGALYGATDADHAADSAGIRAAALTDLGDLTPTPDVSSTTLTDAAGNQYIKVTVTYAFSTITNYPGVPSSFNITQICQMRVQPMTPKAGTY
jgi:Flp pilus assembly protein TadG